jgi:hypothetical protein
MIVITSAEEYVPLVRRRTISLFCSGDRSCA